jgi:hypothetical protein
MVRTDNDLEFQALFHLDDFFLLPVGFRFQSFCEASLGIKNDT